MINSSLKINVINKALKNFNFRNKIISNFMKISNYNFCANQATNTNINQSGLNVNASKIMESNTNITNKTSLYLWKSSVNPGLKKNDLKSRISLSNEPTRVTFFDDKPLKYIYCGIRHSGALTEKGELYMFGTNIYGSLGIGNNKDYSYFEPQLVKYFLDYDIKIKKFACSDHNTIALSEDGDVYTWGYGGRTSWFFPLIRDYGCNGEMITNHRWHPGGVSFFLYNGIIIKDISAGARHVAALDYEGNVYIWGKGHYGIMGTGANFNSLTPMKNLFLEDLRKIDPTERVIKIDCADDYTAALTSKGNLYAWGINNQGQLGTGGGTGKDYTDTEKTPSLVVKTTPGIKYVDVSCGENTMLIKDELGHLYKTGLKVDYVPNLIELTKTVKPKSFFCGRSFYCMFDHNNNVFQWGNLFKKSKIDKNDDDMYMIRSKDLFGDKPIISISSKFTLSGAIIKENQ